jgi:NADH:ubiquinone oxidoreductase subunit 6 (subunit J)
VKLETLGMIALCIGLVASSLAVVLSRHILRSAIFLALALLLTATIYLCLGAELLAGVQVLLYTGGVITLIVFILLLTERLDVERRGEASRGIAPALIASSLVFSILAYFTWASPRLHHLASSTPPSAFGASEHISEALFGEWVLPFEALSLLLLAAIVGALVLARHGGKEGNT